MNDPKKTLPGMRSARAVLGELLKGDPLTSMPKNVDAAAVEKEMVAVRRLFVSGSLWVFSCSLVETVAPDAHAALRNAFGEFRTGGGAKIVGVASKPEVEHWIRAAGRRVIGLELEIAATFNDGMAIARAFREARDKKQP